MHEVERDDAHAALTASVGSASRTTRALLSAFFSAAALVSSAGLLFLVRLPGWIPTVLAALLLQPFVSVALLAALFVAAPHSRFAHAVAQPRAGWVLLVWLGGAMAVLTLELVMS